MTDLELRRDEEPSKAIRRWIGETQQEGDTWQGCVRGIFAYLDAVWRANGCASDPLSGLFLAALREKPPTKGGM